MPRRLGPPRVGSKPVDRPQFESSRDTDRLDATPTTDSCSISMTRQNQKLEEIHFVELMRQALGGVPTGRIEPAEEPDVCVVGNGYRTGIEVTELHQRPDPGGTSRRLQESERSIIVRRAQALAESSAMPVVDVAVHFNELVPIAKAHRDVIVNALVDLVSRHMPTIDASVIVEPWRQPSYQLRCVRTVRLYRAAILTRHHWSAPDSGWVQMDFVPELQHLIDEKNSRYARYRQHCDECWLLIVASGGRPSGLFEPSDQTRNHVFRSSFAKTFFMEAFSGTLIQLNVTTT